MTSPNTSVSLTELQIEFQKIKRFKDRLQKLMELRPESVKGVTIKQLQGNSHKDKTRSKWKKRSLPKEILVKRSGIQYLSELTQLKKKSVERGLSIFFEKTFNLYNTREYSKEWMIFRTDRPKKRKNPEKTAIIRHKSLPLSKSTRPQQKKRATLNSVHQIQNETFALPKENSQKTKSNSKFNLKFKKKRNSLNFKPKNRNFNSQTNTNTSTSTDMGFQTHSKEKTNMNKRIANNFFKSNNSKIDKKSKTKIFHFNKQKNPHSHFSGKTNNKNNNQNSLQETKKKEMEIKSEKEKHLTNEKKKERMIENEEKEHKKYKTVENQQTLKPTLYPYSEGNTPNQEMDEFQKRFYEITFQSNEPENNQLIIDNDIHWSTLGDIWSGDPNKIFL
ncbi:hypothetical protein M0812_21507 [Anaeramoeba flamelloides]|uniref:Uncharacterized protein n=1 Tax=Anaeramoeba flamelloides TaxID=1746091 RepID=A0AAV7YXD2_9EUKA|nr:hypothetical protein M0812_21507 [Anaeramoeba flamelloides]